MSGGCVMYIVLFALTQGALILSSLNQSNFNQRSQSQIMASATPPLSQAIQFKAI